MSVDGTVLCKQKSAVGKGEEKDDRSNFTAWIVPLSSVAMQIFSNSISCLSFRGGNMAMANKVKHKILLERAQNVLWEKNVTMSGDGTCEIVEMLTEASS